MALTPGTRLGPYEITAQIGVGGMGEVYRATDTKLNRDVAIKVLPQALASDAERLARLHREAHVLASLNHSNIAAIYGIEDSNDTHALVLELVEGATLADRISHGPIPIDAALPIAKQIADALDAAHEKGIVHRDLKPANVKVRPDGTVKVLDFGLAKLDPPGSDAASTEAPTITIGVTKEGIIVGSAAYMSPEQARGQVIDKRTDIWAFGCVLYEMFTGGRAFTAPTVSDAIAAILEREPDWSKLPASTPSGVRTLIRHCLEKDRKLRLRDIGDAAQPLNGASVSGVPEEWKELRSSSVWRRSLPWVGGAVMVGLATWFAMSRTPVAPEGVRSARFTISIPPSDQFPIESGMPVPITISPQGDLIVFSARHNGVEQLYVRALADVDAKPIPGTEGGLGPFFSPDGQWIGFYAAHALKKVALTGGPPIIICAAQNVMGGTWSHDGRIAFAAWSSPLMVVSSDGGTPEPVISPNTSSDNRTKFSPQFLHDGSALIFATPDDVEIVDLATKVRQVVVVGSAPHLIDSDHLVFARGGTVFTVPLDIASRTIRGSPVPVLDGVSFVGANVFFAVASNGTLAFLPDSGTAATLGVLAWVDREGRWRPIAADRRTFVHPRLSPDGTRVAVGANGGEVWIYDVTRGTGSRLLASGSRAVWTPDGAQLTIQRQAALYTVSTNAADTPRLLLERAEQGVTFFPLGWSRQNVLAYSDVRGDTNRNVWLLSPDGAKTPFLNTLQDERSATFSPDGRWIVYSIRDEGVPEQVFVQPLSGGDRTIVSVGGGREPLWSPTGREIFYRSLDARQLISVEVTTTPTLKLGTPKVVVETPFTPARTGFFADYDVSRDGERFLMNKVDTAPAPQELEVVLNAITPLAENANRGSSGSSTRR